MIKGLNKEEVRERVAKGRVNSTSKHKTKTVREIFIENIFSLFNFIIFGIIIFVLIFYFRSNDSRLLLDSIGILSIAVINTYIAIHQEIKSKKALDKVSLLLKKKVIVIRDGFEVEIDQSQVVEGDIIKLKRGDQIIVDGKVLESESLEVDESLLTGESLPIIKYQGFEVLSGSFCVSGAGYMQADKVGDDSYANSVTSLAKKYKFVLTPLQHKINLVLKILFGAAISLVVIKILIGKGIESEADYIRDIATILISLVPQGLVLMASVTYAVGVYRISKIGAIVQKLNAIESFSNVKVVCMDKTGTLTKNQLRVSRLTFFENRNSKEEREIEKNSTFFIGGIQHLIEKHKRDESDKPNVESEKFENTVKKLVGTFAELSTEKNATIKAMEVFDGFKNVSKIREMPFSSEKKLSKMEVKIDDVNYSLILGAYDILIEKCEGEYCEFLEKNDLEVYRNLLFGLEQLINNNKKDENEKDEIKIIPLCVISISDTVREDVYDALKLFEKNEIEYKILSGDSPEAIKSVMKEIGIDVNRNNMITGKEISDLNSGINIQKLNKQQKNKKVSRFGEYRKNEKDPKFEILFDKMVREKFIFARLVPEDKLRIIKSLKRQKIYTAMIGDGVNDLPAIKEADMGIAMEEGSQITKEVADIVLLKNKFSLLPQIFNEGNRIVNSVSLVSKLFLTKNFMVIYLTLVSFFLFVYPLTPRRVSLLNIFAIGLPAFILTMKNLNTSKNLFFVKDLLSYVLLSSVIISAGGYAGLYLTKLIFTPELGVPEMVMMSVMIFIAIGNFLIVGKNSESKEISSFKGNRKIFLIYGLLMVVVFVFIAATKINLILLDYLKVFYEIIILEPKYWLITGFVSAGFVGLLWALNLLRERIIKVKC